MALELNRDPIVVGENDMFNKAEAILASASICLNADAERDRAPANSVGESGVGPLAEAD